MILTSSLLALALTLATPGQVIELTAQVSVGGDVQDSTTVRLVVANPVFDGMTFYTCGSYSPASYGTRVRKRQVVGAGDIVIEGIVTDRGTVLSDIGEIPFSQW